MTTEPLPAVPTARVVAPLHPKFFQLDTAGAITASWVATPPAGTLFEDMLKPDYWAHVAQKLRPDAVIRVLPEDRAFVASLMVADVGNQWAKVEVDAHRQRDVANTPSADGLFDIDWGGPILKYRIRRKSDNAVIESGFSSKTDAYARFPDLMKRAA